MLNEIGHFSLLLAFCALMQTTIPFMARTREVMAILESAANLQFALQ